MNSSGRDESVAEALGALARRAAETAPGDEAAARAALLRRVAQSAPPRSPRRWLALIPALSIAGALLIWWQLPSKLRYEVVGAAQNGSYVSASTDRAASVRFSDNTQIEVAAASQLRIDETTRHGGRVLLERGRAQVHVVHRAESRWIFVAGPFEVRVTGTRFDLKWDPVQEAFELDLHEGSVEVQSPLSPAPVVLRAGQEFHADLRRHSMTTTDTATENASPEPAVTGDANPSSPDIVDAQGPDGGATPAPAPAASAPAPSWSKLVATGQFKTLLAQADARGVDACSRTCSAADLSALADAARYTGRSDVADQSLRALRARFVGAPEGRSAAFLLGRMQEQRGAAADARVWYDRYLTESPGGAYAAEALGAKMRMTLKLQGKAAAAPIATDYLRRYPKGVHAEMARGIVDSR